MNVRETKARAEEIKREGILATHVRQRTGLDANSLARSYALPVARVLDIIKRNGGSCG